MAKPEDNPQNEPAGQSKQFTITHPTDPSSPKQCTNEEWHEQKLGQAGWVKGEPISDEPVVTPH